jgi:hypothetical protein
VADYIELELVDDVDTLAQIAFDYLTDNIDGYESRPGNIETILIEAIGQIAGEVVSQMEEIPPVLFAYLGGSLLGLPIQEATAATGSAVIVFTADAPPLTLAEGWQLGLSNPDGDVLLFETVADVTSTPGGSATVGIVAADAGEIGNGAFGTGDPVEVVQGVASVTVAVATAGGTDDEDEDAYLDRLADQTTILAPRPILPSDHATMARSVAGIERAVALDLFIPASTTPGLVGDTAAPEVTTSNQSNIPRATTVAVIADGGVAPSTAQKTAVYTLLNANREVNFLNFVVGPTFSVVDVSMTVKAYPNTTAAAAAAAAQGALIDWLSTWSQQQNESSTDSWIFDNTVRIYEAIEHANRGGGVFYVVNGTVQLRIAGGSFQTTDLLLPGIAPMPTPGTITVTGT